MGLFPINDVYKTLWKLIKKHLPTNVSKTHAEISRPPTPASEQSFNSLSSSLLN